MNHEYLTILLTTGGAILAVFQWLFNRWVKSLETNIEHIQSNQRDIDREISLIKQNYIHKEDFRQFREEIIHKLDIIHDYLLKSKEKNV